MSRRLNNFVESVVKLRIPQWLLGIGLVLAAIGGLYQAGHSLAGWHVFSWFSLVGFGIVVTALPLTAISYQFRYLLAATAGALVMGLVASGSRRFPGLQLQWLWVAAACGAAICCILELGERVSHQNLDPRPPLTRLKDAVLFVGLAMSIVSLALYWSWNGAFYALCVFTPLFAVWGVLDRYEPAPKNYEGAKSPGLVTTSD